jgi:Alternative complex III, ActD subunit
MAHANTGGPARYGLLAEFDSATELVAAAHRVSEAGYAKTDAFSPFPIHGLAEALRFRERKVAPIILAGGLFGMLGGFGLQYWINVYGYPMNIGGRPDNAWVAFIPPTFEGTILCAAFAAVLGMLALNGLPQPYHPVFNAPRFSLASQDKFFLVIEAADPKYDEPATRAFLAGLTPHEVVAIDE